MLNFLIAVFACWMGDVSWLESPLVKKLGDREWKVRDGANRELHKEGRAAFGRLVVGMMSPNVERAERCRVLIEKIGIDPDQPSVVMLADFVCDSLCVQGKAIPRSISLLGKPELWTDDDLTWFSVSKARMNVLKMIAENTGRVFSEYWIQEDEPSRWHQVRDLRRVVTVQPATIPKEMPKDENRRPDK